jgi:hypothetical protein
VATFGYTTVGGTSQSSPQPAVCKFTAPESGTITSITFRAAEQAGGSAASGVAVYADNAGAPGAKLAEDSGNVTVSGSTPAWYTANISLAITGGTPYWLGLWVPSAEAAWYYDAGDTNQAVAENGETFETWPDPFVSVFPFARVISIYATYTPAASGNRRRRMILCGSR